ncbi:MAG: DUF2975 domain-containing protein [Oscillospiraceae bacterium]|nr:DUF2975 domain-containing protein [Oscillospiraceae bacterium]
MDINTRTLDQEKQYLKQTSGIVRIEAVCFAVTIMLLMIQTTLSEAPSDGESASAVFWVKLLFLPFQAVTLAVVTNFVIKLFKEIEAGDTPFRYTIADRLKGLSDAILGGSIVFAAPYLVISILSVFSGTGAEQSQLSVAVMLGAIFLGVLFKSLAYVFSYGCRLQQESDETL